VSSVRFTQFDLGETAICRISSRVFFVFGLLFLGVCNVMIAI